MKSCGCLIKLPTPSMSNKLKSYKLQVNSGQLLIEAIIAITIVVVGILAVFTLLSESQSLNRVVADRYVGTYLASEGIELIKNLVDKNYIQQQPWNLGLPAGSHRVDYNDDVLTAITGPNPALSYDSATNVYSYNSGTATRFTREIQISYPGGSGNEMKVNSIVSWTTRGGGTFDINLEDHFFNWRN